MKRGSAGSIGHGHAGPPSEQGPRSPPSLSANTSICTARSLLGSASAGPTRSCRHRIQRASRPSSTSCRGNLPGRISSWFSTAPPTIAAATSRFPIISRCSSCRPIRQSSTPRKISGMKSARKSSRTTPSNPSTPSAPSSGDPLYRTQSQNRTIHHVLPLYRHITLMWEMV